MKFGEVINMTYDHKTQPLNNSLYAGYFLNQHSAQWWCVDILLKNWSIGNVLTCYIQMHARVRTAFRQTENMTYVRDDAT